MTIREEIISIIRAHRPLLSSGSTGDEGVLMLHLENEIERLSTTEGLLASLEREAVDATRTGGSLLDRIDGMRAIRRSWHGANEDEAGPTLVQRREFLDFAADCVNAYVPRRFRVSPDTVQATFKAATDACRKVYASTEPTLLGRVEESLLDAIRDRSIVRVWRDSPAWDLLLSLDLFQACGPFIREEAALDVDADETGVHATGLELVPSAKKI